MRFLFRTEPQIPPLRCGMTKSRRLPGTPVEVGVVEDLAYVVSGREYGGGESLEQTDVGGFAGYGQFAVAAVKPCHMEHTEDTWKIRQREPANC